MKYAVIYESATGNTKLLAEAVPRELGEESCIWFAPASEASDNIEEKVKDADMIFLGFWTDKGDCSGNIGKCMEKLHGRNVFCSGRPALVVPKHIFADPGPCGGPSWRRLRDRRKLYVSGQNAGERAKAL